jgi:hypothetical protein
MRELPRARAPVGQPGRGAGAAVEIGQRLELSKLGREFLGCWRPQAAPITSRDRRGYRGCSTTASGRVRARVRTAVTLTDARSRGAAGQARARARRQAGGDRGSARQEAPRGFVAEIGSLVVDGSLDGQLARMRERLVKG